MKTAQDSDPNIEPVVPPSCIVSEISTLTCTTNPLDLEEAAKLQERLLSHTSFLPIICSQRRNSDIIPSVSIDEGANKYILAVATSPDYATFPSHKRTFVYSKQGADYHRHVAEYLSSKLEAEGYYNIEILGGGRILRDDESRKIVIYGYSYGFGRADHELSKEIVFECGLFDGYDFSTSDNGY